MHSPSETARKVNRLEANRYSLATMTQRKKKKGRIRNSEKNHGKRAKELQQQTSQLKSSNRFHAKLSFPFLSQRSASYSYKIFKAILVFTPSYHLPYLTLPLFYTSFIFLYIIFFFRGRLPLPQVFFRISHEDG